MKLTQALRTAGRAFVAVNSAMAGTTPVALAQAEREGAKLDAMLDRWARADELIATGQATTRTARAMVQAQDRVAARNAGPNLTPDAAARRAAFLASQAERVARTA